MKIDVETKLDFADVLLVPKHSDLHSRQLVDLEVDFFDLDVVPIVAANMDGVGTFEMAVALSRDNILTALNKHYPLNALIDFYDAERDVAPYAIYSLGANNTDLDKFTQFHAHCVDNDIPLPRAVCVDVANGYTSKFLNFVAEFAENYPEYGLIAGNVVTPEAVESLIDVGADIVKIGIGPGSVCTTRKMTGVGYPQLSAVLECYDAAESARGRIMSDGGCTCPGDVAKAFAAGAHFVMIGGMFAAHEEGLPPGFRDNIKDASKIPFYGMASKAAQELHNGGVADYRASEGKEVYITYRGKVSNTVKNLLGGIRSACTYVGAEDLYQLYHKGKFIKVNRVINEVFGPS
jgi:GMP reductase